MNTGEQMTMANADLMKMWGTPRDSLSSVKIDRQGWNKMYSTDKKESDIVTRYDETDTYKTGKVSTFTTQKNHQHETRPGRFQAAECAAGYRRI